MSRTFRRRKVSKEDKYFVTHKFIVGIGWVPMSPSERKKALRKYHSDATTTMLTIPKWYKTYFCRKPFRAKEKETLTKLRKYMEVDSIVFPVPKNNAKYYW